MYFAKLKALSRKECQKNIWRYVKFLLITSYLAGCQNIGIETEITTENPEITIENFDIDILYEGETVVNYREIYEGDGEAFLDAIKSDHLILYEDLEDTFSVILTKPPTESDLEWPDYSVSQVVYANTSAAVIKKGIISHHVAYFKPDPPFEFTHEYQAELAQIIANNFDPPSHNFRFETNGITGQEFWFFLPVEEGSSSGIHARVRTIVNDDYIYVLRLSGMEDAAFSEEGDKFFASFNLK